MPRISRKWPLFLLIALAILATPFIFLSLKGAKADNNLTVDPTAVSYLKQYAGNFINAQTGATTPSQAKPANLSASAATAPANTTWYFAEGRVGKGFREYFTIENPS